jgi:hypothetical protein
MDQNEAPIQAKHHNTMNSVAQALSEIFEGYGFALLVFDLEVIQGGRMNWISNARREDMLVAMKEFIASCEGRVPPAPSTAQ